MISLTSGPFVSIENSGNRSTILEPLLAPTEWLVQRGNQLTDVGE